MMGDCFVVTSYSDFYWTGGGWSEDVRDAQTFSGPGDPFGDAQFLADLLWFGLSVCCDVVYIPCSKVKVL
jgi:hypothetical protein